MKKALTRMADRVFFKGLTLEERVALSDHIKNTFSTESGQITLRYLEYISGLTDSVCITNKDALLFREGKQAIVKTVLKHTTGERTESLDKVKQVNEMQQATVVPDELEPVE